MSGNLLTGLDYSVLQQCLHCGLCLPSCPTYVETLRERSSPRGRIALMRAIADGRLEVSRSFAEEIYFCLGCLACTSACPAGVDYATLFERARAEVERVGVLDSPRRNAVRQLVVNRLFTSRRRLHALGRLVRLYQRSGMEWVVRHAGLRYLLPRTLRDLEPLTPRISPRFTHQLFRRQQRDNPPRPRWRVGLLSGCVQDLSFAEVNADTVYVLQLNGCEVVVPAGQECCGSLHAHNGESESARRLARINIDAFRPEALDAIITNAGGCGSHMKHYAQLLEDDSQYAERARLWSSRVKDIHEFLVEIGFRPPRGNGAVRRVTYHESCHLNHGQKVSRAPRQVLQSIPGVELVEMREADWCCGSAGIYNITQPEMAMKLLDRKMEHVARTGATVVASGNTGCTIQLEYGSRRAGVPMVVLHPVTLLAQAYRAEFEHARPGGPP
ncbi:MAG: (Fe-S)-binding protein [Candidatus Latescibacterota bacterium]